ncbi:MAG: putative DNA binding domain-containing protein [Proteobacteria bacterium]|nr:putative DNA binding domain-containing protein [Pseudomonadota bacterium]
MLEAILSQNESKTLEFKENIQSLPSIVKAVIAFANTSGGTIVIGVSDKEKSIVGVKNALQEEEKLASSIVDSIEPLVLPDIQIISIRNKEVLLIQVPHLVGPFYLKSVGLERGTYVRVGSTNRVADSETILSLKMLAKNTSYDELPCIGAMLDERDDEIIKTSLQPTFGKIDHKNYVSLGIVSKLHNKLHATNGGILLFSLNRLNWFPDASIACVCFADETHEEILDQQEIKSPLIKAYEEVLAFIRRNTKMSAKIHKSFREDIPQYPHEAVREAVINAIVHADYVMKGSRIQIAVFSDRIEITNPGGLPYGQTMELALSGISRMRNRVIGRLFREIKLIEQLGTGLKRIINVYDKTKAKEPLFQELNTHFRVTLYSTDTSAINLEQWEKILIEKLKEKHQLGTTEIAEFWEVTTRTARTRLKKMAEKDLIIRIGTSPKDPYAVFKLK